MRNQTRWEINMWKVNELSDNCVHQYRSTIKQFTATFYQTRVSFALQMKAFCWQDNFAIKFLPHWRFANSFDLPCLAAPQNYLGLKPSFIHLWAFWYHTYNFLCKYLIIIITTAGKKKGANKRAKGASASSKNQAKAMSRSALDSAIPMPSINEGK